MRGALAIGVPGILNYWSGLRSPRAIERIATSHPNSSKRAYASSAIEHGHAT
jgi:hypothetical protein